MTELNHTTILFNAIANLQRAQEIVELEDFHPMAVKAEFDAATILEDTIVGLALVERAETLAIQDALFTTNVSTIPDRTPWLAKVGAW